MTRAGVFLTAALAAASLACFAQDHSASAASPNAASSAAVAQPSNQNSNSVPANRKETPSDSAQSAPAGRDSSSSATSNSNPASQGSASNDPATANGQLPRTSTILPLLGLIGLGSLVAGLFARR